MESSIITELFLPLALAIIMFGMGLSLTVDDFKRILIYPKAAALGLINQIILLPLVAFGCFFTTFSDMDRAFSKFFFSNERK